jgi:hypothetical protein
VDDVAEGTRRRVVTTHVAPQQLDGRIGGEVRRAGREPVGVARQRHQARAESETRVRPGEALEQPGADEARPASDEEPRAAQRPPRRGSAVEHVVEIGRQRVAAPLSHAPPRGRSRGSPAPCTRASPR